MAARSEPRSKSNDARGIDLAFARTGVFTAEECRALIAWAEAKGIAGPAATETAAEPPKRSVTYARYDETVAYQEVFGAAQITKRYTQLSTTGGTRDRPVARFRRKVCDYLGGFNNRIWGFRVTGFSGLSVLRYEPGDEIGLHVDLTEGHNDRKLMAFVQLCEPDTYAGGEFGFGTPLVAAAREQGSLVIIPAWVAHRVMPLTTGVRYSAVCSALGPSFR